MENELLEYVQTKINEAKEKPYIGIELNNKWSPKQIENALETLEWRYNQLIHSCDCIYRDQHRKYINYEHCQKYALIFSWNGWCQEKSFSMVDR